MRRRSVVAGIALCTAVVPAVSALAHNGVGAAFKGKAGNYTVYAYDGELLPGGRIDYKLVLLDAQTKNPVYDAHPSVTATRPGDSATAARLTTFGNVFFYNLPNPYPHDWDIRLRITGSLGNGEVRYRMHGATPTANAPASPVVSESGSSSWPLILGAVGGAVLLAGLGYWLIRRRGRRLPASPQ
jgi:hypothetical protein